MQSEAAKEKLCQCYDREWFRSAPLYIICLKDTTSNWIRSFDNKAYGDIDLAIAIEHLCLAATKCGLGTCWVCNYDPEKLSQLFPMTGYEAVAIIPLGHIAPECPQKEKQRKSLEEIIEYI